MNDVEAEARALLADWRRAPYVELAAALERFPARQVELPKTKTPTQAMEAWLERWRVSGPLDVPAMLGMLDATIATQVAKFMTPCLDALARAEPDPRIAKWALSRLHVISHVRQPTRAAYKALLSVVWRHASTSNTKALERLSDHDSPWRIVLGMGGSGAGRYGQILRVLQRRADALPQSSFEMRARWLEVGAEAAKTPVPAAAPASREPELLAAIRADPSDPQRRAVFRDWLLENGDPWGELMALQEQGRKTARERVLLKELRPRILGQLAGLKKNVLADVVVSRGFLTEATVRMKGVTRVTALLDQPELATLESLSFVLDGALTENLVALREVHGLTPEQLLQARKKVPLPLEVVTVVCEAAALRTFEGWPELKELYVAGTFAPVPALASLWRLPLTKSLRAVGVRRAMLTGATALWQLDLFEKAPPNIERVVMETYGALDVSVELARVEGGWSVSVQSLASRDAGPPARVLDSVKGLTRMLADPRVVSFELDPSLQWLRP